ncbi:MAG: phage tail protein [Raoultibacter sp.]
MADAVKNKVKYGLSNCHIAPIDPATGEYQASIKLPGIIKFTASPEGNSTVLYADDTAYYVAQSNNGYTGELEAADIPDDVLAIILGNKTDANGIVYESADDQGKNFALLFEINGDAQKRRVAYYNCSAARPETENETNSEDIKFANDKIKLTMIPTVANDKKIIRGVKAQNGVDDAVFKNWFTKVTRPGDTIAEG